MRLKFVKKQHEVGDVWSYYFQPLEPVVFEAGQYLNLSMPDVAPVFADRIFTIASAPHEELLQFTTILTPSPFKQKLDSLRVGEEVEVDQLGGDFTYDAIQAQNSAIPVHAVVNVVNKASGAHIIKRLFIAGGVGVTPFLSIIRDKLYKQEPLHTVLLYAGKDTKRPFSKELHKATKSDPTFKLKEYSTTRLTLSQLKKDVPNIEDYIVYLAGSQKFSEDIGEGLVSEGFPHAQIKYDYFDGYLNIEY